MVNDQIVNGIMRTFKIGGVHPQDNKSFSAHQPIVECPLPKQAIIPLVQHIGAPTQAVVAVGAKVKVGELLAKAGGFVSANICSPVSGTVTKIGDWKDAWGAPGQAIFIDVEGDEWLPEIDRSPALITQCSLDSKAIIDKIAAAGIVGLGGACFPTHVKLLPPPGKKAEVLIVNGVECEPYLTCDHQLMLEHGEEIIIGIELLKKALGVDRAIIGIENNKPDAIEHMTKLAQTKLGIEVMPLKLRYPQGGEKQLIDACIGRQVPSGALPIEVGAVVDNVATIFAVYEAVQKNKPIVQTYTTVSGRSLRPDQCKNYRLRIGTPILSVLQSVGIPEDTGKIISGGPMMGKAIANLGAYTAKGMSSLLFMNEEESARGEVHPCLHCGKCVSVCPMGLEPYMLQTFTELKRWDDTEKYGIMNCIECGSCAFICPSNRPILDMIRVGKAKTGGIIRARNAK